MAAVLIDELAVSHSEKAQKKSSISATLFYYEHPFRQSERASTNSFRLSK